MLMAADGREVTLLGILDLSAAFDCMDHTILRIRFGVTDVTTQWITSFLTDGTDIEDSLQP